MTLGCTELPPSLDPVCHLQPDHLESANVGTGKTQHPPSFHRGGLQGPEKVTDLWRVTQLVIPEVTEPTFLALIPGLYSQAARLPPTAENELLFGLLMGEVLWNGPCSGSPSPGKPKMEDKRSLNNHH